MRGQKQEFPRDAPPLLVNKETELRERVGLVLVVVVGQIRVRHEEGPHFPSYVVRMRDCEEYEEEADEEMEGAAEREPDQPAPLPPLPLWQHAVVSLVQENPDHVNNAPDDPWPGHGPEHHEEGARRQVRHPHAHVDHQERKLLTRTRVS